MGRGEASIKSGKTAGSVGTTIDSQTYPQRARVAFFTLVFYLTRNGRGASAESSLFRLAVSFLEQLAIISAIHPSLNLSFFRTIRLESGSVGHWTFVSFFWVAFACVWITLVGVMLVSSALQRNRFAHSEKLLLVLGGHLCCHALSYFPLTGSILWFSGPLLLPAVGVLFGAVALTWRLDPSNVDTETIVYAALGSFAYLALVVLCSIGPMIYGHDPHAAGFAHLIPHADTAVAALDLAVATAIVAASEWEWLAVRAWDAATSAR